MTCVTYRVASRADAGTAEIPFIVKWHGSVGSDNALRRRLPGKVRGWGWGILAKLLLDSNPQWIFNRLGENYGSAG